MYKLFCNKIILLAYLLSIVLYTGQGFFFEGTWFTSLAGYFILMVNLVFTASYFLRGRSNKVLRWMMLFVIWTIVVWFVSPKSINTYSMGVMSTLPMVQYTLIIMTTTFSVIAFKQDGVLKDAYMILFYVGILSLLVMNFFFERTATLFDSEQTSNLGYPIVSLMPLTVFFWKKKTVFWSIVLFIFIMSLVSVKRGAILCSGVFILIIIYSYLKELRKIKIKTIIALCVVCGLVLYICSQFLNNSEFLQQRLLDTLDGNSSSRDYIYEKILNRWSDANTFHQLLGNGPIATTKFGQYAHNDWLEVLYDFGIVGLLFYVFFVFGIYIFLVRKKYVPVQCNCAFFLVFLYYVLRSTFSMSFYVLDTVLVMFAFGYFLSECNLQKK